MKRKPKVAITSHQQPVAKITPWWVTELPAFEPLDFEPDWSYWDLKREIELLIKCVEANTPADTDLHKLFMLAFTTTDDKRLPLRRGLKAARTMFEELPLDEQRRILNGWGWIAKRDRPIREKIRDERDGADVVPTLEIDAGHNAWVCGFGATFTDSTHPVQMQILVGSRKLEVLEALRLITREIESGWDTIVAGKTPIIHDPGSCKDGMICTLCGKSFTLVSQIEEHLARVHGRTDVADITSDMFIARIQKKAIAAP